MSRPEEPRVEAQSAGSALARHKWILLALVACTAVMVTLALLPLGTGLKVGLILTVASVEACLVAGVLMHLIEERKLILSILVLTAIFFVGLLALPILAEVDHARHFFK
jgi:cytochrome c oxidase subunit IV